MNPIDFFLTHGVNVFPISPGTKEPDVPKGTSWKSWQGPRPTGPYGVELGALMVVDGDSSLSTAWIRANCPATPFRVQTGPHHDSSDMGRGVHFYYRAPACQTPAFIHRDGLVIEARRAGQYVVGPGSIHPSGCTYTSTNWSWSWDGLPVFLADFAFHDGTRLTTLAGQRYEVPERVTAGERTAELFKFARSFKARGASEQMARYAVEVFNRDRCEPPKSDEWLLRWFNRAWHQADRPDFAQLPTITEDETLPIVEESAS